MDLERMDQALRDASMIWLARKVELFEDDTLLPEPRILSTRVALESDRSFASYEQALAHVTGPALGNDVSIFWEQGLLDVLFEYPIRSDRSHFAIHMAFDRLGIRVVTALRFMPPGVVRAYELEGDAGLVPLDPRWSQAVLRFVNLGFFHILDGTDHLLFLFCLVIPFRRIWTLVPIVTAFTVAHSITLIASAYNLGPDSLWFPPLIETFIATSIVYMALENILGANLHRRWLITFGFGLVHGFGFSFALKQTLQFAGSHLLTSLLSFNIGVELGQLLVLSLLIPALDILFARVVQERMGTIILSGIVAHTGWHWMTDRFNAFRQYDLSMPEFTPAFVAELLRYAMALVAIAAILWAISAFMNTPGRFRPEADAARSPKPEA